MFSRLAVQADLGPPARVSDAERSELSSSVLHNATFGNAAGVPKSRHMGRETDTRALGCFLFGSVGSVGVHAQPLLCLV